jgi:hypothetical protein
MRQEGCLMPLAAFLDYCKIRCGPLRRSSRTSCHLQIQRGYVAASRVIAKIGGGKTNLSMAESFHGPDDRDRRKREVPYSTVGRQLIYTIRNIAKKQWQWIDCF